MTPAPAVGTSKLPKPFWQLWLGVSVSSFGSYVTLLGLQVLVLETMHGTAQDVGWLNSARWLPYLLLGLFAGTLVERRRRRPVMVTTDVACGVLIGLIPLSWALGILSLPVLVTLVALYGAAALFNDAASMAFLPRLIDRGQLQRAHARIDGSSAVAQTTGPALAGVLIKLVGAPLAILIDAVSYLFSAAMMASIRIRERTPAAGPRVQLRREIREGLHAVYRSGLLGRLAVSTHVWFAANAILGVAIPTFALITLKLSAVQFGIVSAVAGLGAVVGAGVSTAAGRAIGTGGAIILAHAITVVGVLVMALASLRGQGMTAMLVLAAGQGCHGVAMGLSNSHEMSYRQAMTPDHLQARTNITMRSANRAVIVFVAPVAGLLVNEIGTRSAIFVAAVIFGLVVVLLCASPFRAARITPL